MVDNGGSFKKVTEDYLKIFLKLRKEGRTIKEISDRFGFSESRVSTLLKEYRESNSNH